MKAIIKIILFSVLSIVITQQAWAAKPACHATHGGYCSYNGKVNSIYVNSANLILIYFEEPLAVGEGDIAGFNVTNRGAAAIRIDSKPEFANLFYSTALTAQASGRNISIQMRGTEGGYLKFDRIWLSQ